MVGTFPISRFEQNIYISFMTPININVLSIENDFNWATLVVYFASRRSSHRD